MSDQEILTKINYMKGMVKEIVQKIQNLKIQLAHAEISLDDFRSQRMSLENKLREILGKIAALKENIKLTIRVRERPLTQPQIEQDETELKSVVKEEPIFTVPEDFMYYFSTEFEDFLNKANIYLSGYIEDRFIEIGFIEFFFPPTTEKKKPFNVTALIVQRGDAESIRISLTLTDISDYNDRYQSSNEGIIIDLEPEKPKAITFKIIPQATHMYSFRAVLKQIDSKEIKELNDVFFDFEVKALPFAEIQNTIDMFETKTGKYLVYSYLACEKEEAELLQELKLNLNDLGVNNFEPLFKIIPATVQTRNLLEIGQEINENILFLINNFKYLSLELYDFQQINILEQKLLNETESLFKFAPDGIILRPLEKMENALKLSMLFRTFFKICKLGIRKLNLLKTISEIGKDYKLDISKYFLYINTIKTKKVEEIQ